MKNNLSAKANFGVLSVVGLQILLLFIPFIGSKDYSIKDEIEKSYSEKIISKSKDIFTLSEEDQKWIDQTLSTMSLYDKCTQVFMPAVSGKSLKQSSREFKSAMELVRIQGIGGIVISNGNVDETVQLIHRLQKNAKIPLVIAADFENGIGMRMNASNTFPKSMAVGSTNNSEYAYQVGYATATEALMLGVNMNFAPVADVNNNPDNPVINLRSYSEDKNLVTEFCESYINGSLDGGVIPTIKHFPGHGNTKIDSHNDLPVISGDKNYLYKNELAPFIKLIENNVPAIMIGHLSVPAFDENVNLPASLSYNIITKLLKEKLNYKGLIITDALDMKAVTKYFSAGEACLLAFKAGNDILLMPQNIKEGISSVYKAVKSGEISKERLDESVRKILSVKRWLKLDEENFKKKKKLPKRIRIAEHYNLSKIIAEKSVTVVKMEDGLLPLDSAKFTKTLLVDITNRSSIKSTHFSDIYNENFSIYGRSQLTTTSKNAEYQNSIEKAKDCDLIVIAAYFYVKNDSSGNVLSEEQNKFIKNLLALNKKVIIISFENPYILSLFPHTKNYICTFSDTESSQRAALSLLNGSIVSSGQLPITIPNTKYKIGYKWEPNI